jgi:prepilin-type processing-associated H-X9-DG protein
MKTKKGKSNPSIAFTLIELFVVIAIILVVASISLVSISSAKKKAKKTVCLKNVKQMGIWLSEFVTDRGEYPLNLNTELTNKYPEHASTWMGTLRRTGGFSEVINQGDAGDLFNCPSAKAPSDLGVNGGYFSYGYNSDGIVGSASDKPLGLGGYGSEAGGIYPPPVKAAAVVNPAEMIAIGDSFLGSPPDIAEGRYGNIGLRLGVAVQSGETARAMSRHDKQGMFLFCDSHVQATSLDRLYIKPQQNLARFWNRDNKPHLERFP